MHIAWASDTALLITFAEADSDCAHAQVVAAHAALTAARLPGAIDITAAYASLLIAFAAPELDFAAIEAQVRGVIASAADAPSAVQEEVTIPVCYDEAFAPDLHDVAAFHRITPAEVVRLHCSAAYTVRFLGFSPGFPYLAGLPAQLHTPRLAAPRTRVPAGSVAIAATQAGIYPQSTPGGWRILGRTPLTLFDASREGPALLRLGVRVRFRPISRAEFDKHARGAP